MSLIDPQTGDVLTGVGGGPSHLNGKTLPAGFQGGLGFLEPGVVAGQQCDSTGCGLWRWDGSSRLPLVDSARAVWHFVANGHGAWAADATKDGVRGCEDWRGRFWPGYAPFALGEDGLLAISRQQADPQDFLFFRPADPADVAWRVLVPTGVRRGATIRHGRFAYTEDGSGWRVYRIMPDGLVDESPLWATCETPAGGGRPEFCEIGGTCYVLNGNGSNPRGAALLLHQREDGLSKALVLTHPGELAFWPSIAAVDGAILVSGCRNDRDQPADVQVWDVLPWHDEAGTLVARRDLLAPDEEAELRGFVDVTQSATPDPPDEDPPMPDPSSPPVDLTPILQRLDGLTSVVSTLGDAVRVLGERVDDESKMLVQIVGTQTAAVGTQTDILRDLAARLNPDYRAETVSEFNLFGEREVKTAVTLKPVPK